jgi:NAD(P)-dependent dehydrogenase (short-subunit alcohol dehydrogenase family)
MKTSIRTHEGRVSLVSRSGQGIGQAIALTLAEPGAWVIATDRAKTCRMGTAGH